jgi:NADPH:quinone reductase-like Zn-dependent oxidoreductase
VAPARHTHEEAAAIPYGGLLALPSLRKGDIRPGQRVLVYGASGAIGTAALQIAKHLGAEVTAVCGPSNAELVRSLGADTVLDYTRDETPGDAGYALVFDAVGRRLTSPLKVACATALAAGGRYVSIDDGLPRVERADLLLLRALADEGELQPVVDRCYPMAEVAAAHRYVEQRHKRGNVVLTIE